MFARLQDEHSNLYVLKCVCFVEFLPLSAANSVFGWIFVFVLFLLLVYIQDAHPPQHYNSQRNNLIVCYARIKARAIFYNNICATFNGLRRTPFRILPTAPKDSALGAKMWPSDKPSTWDCRFAEIVARGTRKKFAYARKSDIAFVRFGSCPTYICTEYTYAQLIANSTRILNRF